MYCDGSYADTPTAQTVGGPDRELDPEWQGRGQGQRGLRGKKGGGPELVEPQNALGGSNQISNGGSGNGGRPWWDALGLLTSKA